MIFVPWPFSSLWSALFRTEGKTAPLHCEVRYDKAGNPLDHIYGPNDYDKRQKRKPRKRNGK